MREGKALIIFSINKTEIMKEYFEEFYMDEYEKTY